MSVCTVLFAGSKQQLVLTWSSVVYNMSKQELLVMELGEK